MPSEMKPGVGGVPEVAREDKEECYFSKNSCEILMADSSSDSDNFLTRRIGRRVPLRASYNRAQSYGAEVTEKIHTLASTLQQISHLIQFFIWSETAHAMTLPSMLFFKNLFNWFCSVGRDYGDSQGNKHRRSRSASVRFVSDADNWEQLHSFHQSLRDLSSEQVRLGDDISRELSRRNRYKQNITPCEE
ncbi:Centrosomal protein of 128 kDa [Willisornis vidua]|uniref:Centrosomal protein of 128 kDa n=1 Tax=Willisornis vidua TaxID=1566151 RepID=A0ABQ9CTV9_9PASS|nr:Centrosomal protein of 128 kDa [Willisornis vidua]